MNEMFGKIADTSCILRHITNLKIITFLRESQMILPDEVFTSAYHKKTPQEMSQLQLATLNEQPKVRFMDLEIDKTYAYKHGSNEYQFYKVKNITSSKKWIDFQVLGKDITNRFHVKSFYNDFIEVTDSILALLKVTHEMVISVAVTRGLEVPPLVRRYQPHLFVDIPPRFSKEITSTHKESSVERVKNALHPYMHFKIIGKDTIQNILDRTVKEFNHFLDIGLKQKELNPEVEFYYDMAAKGFHDTIDFYTWLLPHVSPGGIFFVKE